MLTVNVNPDIAEQIGRLADETRMDTEALVDQALRAYLAQFRQEKIRTETQAFEQQRASLLRQYRGEYVAIHEGRVIDHDPDLRTLHLRVFARLRHTPVLLKKVTEEPDRELVFRSPRFERGQL
jgi:predicted transcriptional regulator